MRVRGKIWSNCRRIWKPSQINQKSWLKVTETQTKVGYSKIGMHGSASWSVKDWTKLRYIWIQAIKRYCWLFFSLPFSLLSLLQSLLISSMWFFMGGVGKGVVCLFALLQMGYHTRLSSWPSRDSISPASKYSTRQKNFLLEYSFMGLR